MKTRRTLLALASAAALAALTLSACSSPGDEAWLRVTGFRKNGTTTTINLLSTPLSGSEELVDVGVTNMAERAGQIRGTGIYLDRVDVAYRFGSAALPSYSWGVSLYLPEPGDDGHTEGWIAGLPLASGELKATMAALGPGPFTVQAEVTVHGTTDEGKDVEAIGGLPIQLTAP